MRGVELSGKYAGITAFRSIPYAAPPTGELRFRPPVDPEPWVGELDASLGAPRPMQETGDGMTREPWFTDFYYMGMPPMSEDCLYLSVATPAKTTKEALPVMVFIHGGAFRTEHYGGDLWQSLARRGIVAVSIEYRAGALGFMAHPELSKVYIYSRN